MRFQLLSNIWNKLPKQLDAHAPTLILCGNIGRLAPHTFVDVCSLTRRFDTVYWIPYAAETFREDGRPIDALIVREMIHDKTEARCLTNEVCVGPEGETLIGTSGWWPGRGDAPLCVGAWRDEDADFIKETAARHATLISAGSHYSIKPATVVGGIVPVGSENFRMMAGRQTVITNDAQAPGFDPNMVFGSTP